MMLCATTSAGAQTAPTAAPLSESLPSPATDSASPVPSDDAPDSPIDVPREARVLGGPGVGQSTDRPRLVPVIEKLVAPCPERVPGGASDLPPVFNSPSYMGEAKTEEIYVFETEARDPEGTPIKYRATSLPAGARLEWRLVTYHPCDDPNRPPVSATAPRIVWTPTRSQFGKHRFEIVASDGVHETTTVHEVVVKDDWEAFFLPGASYSVYAPRGAGAGLYHGPSFELLLGAWIHRNERRGPSHGRVYANVGVLESTAGTDAVSAALGFDLSIERNPRRSFLIPYFGLEVGGLFRQTAVSVAAFTPALGLHLYSSRNVMLNLSGGYLFPTARIDELLGYTGRVSIDVALW